MKYNLLFVGKLGGFNIMNLDEKKLPIIVDNYELGTDGFTISGRKYSTIRITTLKIFESEFDVDLELFRQKCIDNGLLLENFIDSYFSEKALKYLGKDVTDEFIGDLEFGWKSQNKHSLSIKNIINFVDLNRIKDIEQLENSSFDFTRLVKLCEELNIAHRNSCYLSVGMLGRTIINHIPPLFDFETFEQFSNNYGGNKTNKSFKKNMQNLNSSLKNIADGYLHEQIRKSESLPNEVQINFSQDLDCLLAEIVRILKNK